jgi:superfamily I DNA/RNA helicase
MAWIAWLLRFALPTMDDPKDRFREMPNAYSPVSGKYGPWHHIVIDEAQDLSVVEASLLSSFVVRDGALTIAADFRQVVSPVHGMMNPDAFKIGCNLIGKGDDFTLFPFTKNMRQSGQIGKFLRGFYEKVFGELPQFVANEEMIGPKPQLFLMPYVKFSQTIRKMLNVFREKKVTGSMAFLQINEDEDEMVRYREMLEKENIRLAPIWDSGSSDGTLVTTSVERIKGLEYDMCFIVGLEKAENTMLNYNRNRAYVALSRPAQRLYMFCEHIPSLLHGIHNDLYDLFDTR